MILGIDEVGRGAWAGPLVVGAALLNGSTIVGLTDSKALTKRKREDLYEQIITSNAEVALGWVHASELDKIGLSNALVEATKRAVAQISSPYHEIIIDGTVNFLKSTAKGRYVTTIKKADLLIPSVSAASIVAKVARDEFMASQDLLFPAFGFNAHVGYGTAAHRAAIKAKGITPLHRKSFASLHEVHIVSNKENLKRSSTSIGNEGEAVACTFLQQAGLTIIERNWKTKLCEIDIVATKNGTHYFAEVKYRSSSSHGDGLSSITPTKLKQMRFAAQMYIHFHALDVPQRLLVVATTGVPAVVSAHIEVE